MADLALDRLSDLGRHVRRADCRGLVALPAGRRGRADVHRRNHHDCHDDRECDDAGKTATAAQTATATQTTTQSGVADTTGTP
jgi:hypothetical protein